MKASHTWTKAGCTWEQMEKPLRSGQPGSSRRLPEPGKKAGKDGSLRRSSSGYPLQVWLVLPRCREGASRETSPFQGLRPALAGTVTPARVRRELALPVPPRATLATVLSLDETGGIPLFNYGICKPSWSTPMPNPLRICAGFVRGQSTFVMSP